MYGSYLRVSGICFRRDDYRKRNGIWGLLVSWKAALSKAAAGAVWLSDRLVRAGSSGKTSDCVLCVETGQKRGDGSAGILPFCGILLGLAAGGRNVNAGISALNDVYVDKDREG